MGHPGDADAEPAQQFVQYMLSDGYVDWLAIAPEGKFPVRAGTQETDASTSTPGRRCRSASTPRRRWRTSTRRRCSTSLQRGRTTFTRWGITQGQGDLIGASLGELPVPRRSAR